MLFGDIDWNQVMMKGLIGGVVGGVIGLVAYFVKKAAVPPHDGDKKDPQA